MDLSEPLAFAVRDTGALPKEKKILVLSEPRFKAGLGPPVGNDGRSANVAFSYLAVSQQCTEMESSSSSGSINIAYVIDLV